MGDTEHRKLCHPKAGGEILDLSMEVRLPEEGPWTQMASTEAALQSSEGARRNYLGVSLIPILPLPTGLGLLVMKVWVTRLSALG